MTMHLPAIEHPPTYWNDILDDPPETAADEGGSDARMERVELGREGRTVTAHVAGGASLLRLRPGDAVVVELFPYDAGRGRIVRRR